jgi:hypothetical protein
MLIINLPNMAKSKQAGQEGVFNKPREPHKAFIKHGTSGSDVVEISAEARHRLEEEQLISLEAARMRKMAGDAARMLREAGSFDGGDLRRLYRPYLVNEVKDEIAGGEYDFADRMALAQAAERLLTLIAA